MSYQYSAQCIFCQNGPFALPLVIILILPASHSLPPAIQSLAEALCQPIPLPVLPLSYQTSTPRGSGGESNQFKFIKSFALRYK